MTRAAATGKRRINPVVVQVKPYFSNLVHKMRIVPITTRIAPMSPSVEKIVFIDFVSV